MTIQLERCGTCKALIYKLRSVTTGKTGPMDAQTRVDGNVEVDLEAGTYDVLGGARLKAAHEGMWGPDGGPKLLHTSHYATCPDAAAWRGKR